MPVNRVEISGNQVVTALVVGDDYGVTEPADSCAAIGCGDQATLGALFATAAYPDQAERLRIALSAAERFSNGVRRPFVFVQT